ncbi:MAG: HesA/MoeB/ThiF family protein [Epsilonproteobacteria bacterium]|nr:HesA/MoeB/ThiF family protein [Campylobacterota bacterium]
MQDFHEFNARLEKNFGIFSPAELSKIAKTRVLIVGLGGIGGYLANTLVRLGVRQLTLVDFDKFKVTNLNRQLFSSLKTIDKFKVDIIKDELLKIDPSIKIDSQPLSIEALDGDIVSKVDVVFDAVDVIKTKINLEKMCSKYNLPLIHGALGGWFGQVGISLPKSSLLEDFYGQSVSGLEDSMGAPTFIPPLVAHYMVVQFILLCLGKKEALINQILNIDALQTELSVVYKK